MPCEICRCTMTQQQVDESRWNNGECCCPNCFDSLDRTEQRRFEKTPVVIGMAYRKTVWDGRGFWRVDDSGRQNVIFADVSPYPVHAGAIVFGVSDSLDRIGFSGEGCPWTTDNLEYAFQFANGVDIP